MKSCQGIERCEDLCPVRRIHRRVLTPEIIVLFMLRPSVQEDALITEVLGHWHITDYSRGMFVIHWHLPRGCIQPHPDFLRQDSLQAMKLLCFLCSCFTDILFSAVRTCRRQDRIPEYIMAAFTCTDFHSSSFLMPLQSRRLSDLLYNLHSLLLSRTGDTFLPPVPYNPLP